MIDSTLMTLPFIGLGLGIIHAFDADHVLAVAGIAAQENKQSHSHVAKISMRWGIGHAGTLFVLAFLSLVLGYYLPPNLSSYAEIIIGVMLIALGIAVLSKVILQRQVLQRNKYYALMVGAIHGLAGSASVLAILTVQTAGNAWLGMIYVLLFGIGVATSMCVFSLSVLRLSQFLKIPFLNKTTTPVIIGSISIMFGLFWLQNIQPII